MTFTGLDALRLRVEERHEDETSRKKYLQDLVKEQIPAAAEVDLTNKPDWASSSPSFLTEFKIKVPGWMSGAGRRALLPIGIFTASEKNVFTHAERVHPIYFEFPFSREDDITIALPLGLEVGSLPPAQTEGRGPVLYSFQAEKNNAILHLTRKLRSTSCYSIRSTITPVAAISSRRSEPATNSKPFCSRSVAKLASKGEEMRKVRFARYCWVWRCLDGPVSLPMRRRGCTR